jgi:hypothetical protein
MKRRLLLLAGLLLLTLLGGWVVHAMQAPRHRITFETYEKVRSRMRRAEVEELFGVPPGAYNRHRVGILVRKHWEREPRHFAPIPSVADVQEWWGDNLLVNVAFDDAGAVTGFDFWYLIRRNEPFLDKVRRWFRLD